MAPHLEPISLHRGLRLTEPHEAMRYIIFPESGIISIVIQSADGKKAEGGIIGREGFVAPFVLMGADRSPYLFEVQVAGHGYHIEVQRFIDIANRTEIKMMGLRFAQALSTQTSYTAMLNAAYPIDERLARWILMCHDRSDSDDIALTHEYMAVMLCVRRASVTIALHALEERGLILTERGVVTVVSRARLERFAKDTYGPPEAEHVRLMGPL